MSERDIIRHSPGSMPKAGLFAALRVFLAAAAELALFATRLHRPHRDGARRRPDRAEPHAGSDSPANAGFASHVSSRLAGKPPVATGPHDSMVNRSKHLP